MPRPSDAGGTSVCIDVQRVADALIVGVGDAALDGGFEALPREVVDDLQLAVFRRSSDQASGVRRDSSTAL